MAEDTVVPALVAMSHALAAGLISGCFVVAVVWKFLDHQRKRFERFIEQLFNAHSHGAHGLSPTDPWPWMLVERNPRLIPVGTPVLVHWIGVGRFRGLVTSASKSLTVHLATGDPTDHEHEVRLVGASFEVTRRPPPSQPVPFDRTTIALTQTITIGSRYLEEIQLLDRLAEIE